MDLGSVTWLSARMIAELRCWAERREFIDLVADYGGRWAEVWVGKKTLLGPHGADVHSMKIKYIFSLRFIVHVKKEVLYYLSIVVLVAAPKGCERRDHAHHA